MSTPNYARELLEGAAAGAIVWLVLKAVPYP